MLKRSSRSAVKHLKATTKSRSTSKSGPGIPCDHLSR
jgi:hypothetical protein